MNQTNHSSDVNPEENGQPRVFSGVVASIKPLDRLNAQVQLKGIKKVFRLSVSSEWILSKGDNVSLAGTKDEQGVWICFAYRNHSMGVEGRKEAAPAILGIGFALFGAFFFVLGIIISTGGSFGIAMSTPGLAIMVAGISVYMVSTKTNSRIRKQTSLLEDQSSSGPAGEDSNTG